MQKREITVRHIAWFLTVLAMAVSMAAGCTGRKSAEVPKASGENRKKQSGTLASPAECFPITEKTFTLKVLAKKENNVEDVLTNSFTLEYVEKTNVAIQWELVAPQSAVQRLNMALGARKDVPDVFLNMGITNNQTVTYGTDRHMLVDLKPYIREYAPNIQKMLDYNPKIEEAITAPDGGIYTLPEVEESFHTRYPQKAWIYRPWLDALGLEMPENLQELEAVLTAFRDGDPNGNGKQDEIPMIGATTGWMTLPVDYLMSPFVYSDQQRLNVDSQGRVTAPYSTPQWREGLRYMHHLCKDGLLDPRSLFQDYAQLRELTMVEGENIVGVVTAGAPGTFLSANHPRWEDWAALPPMADDQGNCVTATRPFKINVGKFAVSSSCPDPAVAVRWVDYFYSEEGTLRATVGVEGQDWRRAEAGERGINGEQGSYVRYKPYVAVQNSHWSKMVPCFQPDAMRNHQVELSGTNEQMLYEITKKYYEPYGVENVMEPLFFPPEVVEQMETSKFLLEGYAQEAYTKFILGEWNIENDRMWNQYLEHLKSLRLDEYLIQCTASYQKQYMK